MALQLLITVNTEMTQSRHKLLDIRLVDGLKLRHPGGNAGRNDVDLTRRLPFQHRKEDGHNTSLLSPLYVE